MSIEFEFGRVGTPLFDFAYPAHQVHGVRCVEVMARGQDHGEADGYWTRTVGIPVHVRTADCVPILLAHQDGTAVAALHAGWRGVLARIPEHFFASLPPELSRPGEWQVWLGPSIRSECYEVSPELIEQFVNEFSDLDPSWIEPTPRRLDLIAVLQHQLRVLGCQLKSIDPGCTFCSQNKDGSPTFLSYRRGDRQARQYSWIRLVAS
jgi:YfiH family protein